ncbi:hypothetical protein MMC10_010674 [Thelotrema lepadinum]|nr:hypothetical protein [Thelotrema lepadinum]
MDSSAYLMHHGWRGKGNSLHPSGRGIKKPLSVSRKVDNSGVGKKKIDVQADQWWARAFDAGLEGLKLGNSESSVAHSTSTNKRLGDLALVKAGGQKWVGLFDGFVKGESLQGTLAPSAEATHDSTPPISQRQRLQKSDTKSKSKHMNGATFLKSNVPETVESRPDSNILSLQGRRDAQRKPSSSSDQNSEQRDLKDGREANITIGQGTGVDENNLGSSPLKLLNLAEPKRKKQLKRGLGDSFTESSSEPQSVGGSSNPQTPREGRRKSKKKARR